MKKTLFLIVVILFLILEFFVFKYFFPFQKEEVEKVSEPIFSLANFLEENSNPFYLTFYEDIREELLDQEIDFLEANLGEMKVRVYKEGGLAKEVPILTKGNVEQWGGSPIGLYSVISGGETNFSYAALAYMPFALKFYGKYFIHGEPYYSGGEKIVSQFSGGCLRLKNEYAREIYGLTDVGMPVLMIDKERDEFEYPKEKIFKFPGVSAQGYLIADLDSGYIFAQKDSEKQFPIASLTKLMTALVISENVILEDDILIRDYMLNGYGSTRGLEPGQRLKAVELLYPLLTESSNDAAEVLTYFLGRDTTIDLMNQKTESMLMTNTRFAGPSGFSPDNVSTARDLFYLTRYILNNRSPILKITRGEKLGIYENFTNEELWNKNVFSPDTSLVGAKTGYIKEAKNTGIFVFKFLTKDDSERNIVFIILKSSNTKSDTQRMYSWLQRSFSLTPNYE
tara:strand:+ start:1004 stop:2362 length:1359 start_codon:yes stop_codon:yes gene_type:complete